MLGGELGSFLLRNNSIDADRGGMESDVATALNAGTLAEMRKHWKGPFQCGAPDMIVVHMTKDTV